MRKNPTTPPLSKPVKEIKPDIMVLRLYVAGETARSVAAFANLHKICEEHLAGRYKIQVVDLKLHMAVRWFIGGKTDHIPATIFSSYPKLMRVHDAVRDHAGVKSWYAKG